MRILVLGASGMLGHKILLKFLHRHEVMGTLRKPNQNLSTLFRGHESILKTGIDAFNTDTLRALIADFKPDAVINCIGIVKQLKEAQDPFISISINALLPHQLEKLGTEFGFRLIHLSTDCVFSGEKGPYTEGDESDVSDLYGQTKYLGEVKGARALTLRTSIVGREISSPFTGLIEWFLAQRGKTINGYTGALYTGLTTNLMADVIENILTNHKNLSGLYHLSADAISKFDLLNLLKAETGVDTIINPYDDFKCDRRLDSSRLRAHIHWSPPSWPEMIRAMLAEDAALYKNLARDAA